MWFTRSFFVCFFFQMHRLQFCSIQPRYQNLDKLWEAQKRYFWCESIPLLSNILFMIAARKKHDISLHKLILFLQKRCRWKWNKCFRKNWNSTCSNKKPGAIIKEVNSDELCVVHSFQEGLRLCYNMDVKLSDVLDGLRSEIQNNHSFYVAFSSSNINVLC